MDPSYIDIANYELRMIVRFVFTVRFSIICYSLIIGNIDITGIHLRSFDLMKTSVSHERSYVTDLTGIARKVADTGTFLDADGNIWTCNSNGPARHTERGFGSIIKLEVVDDELKVAGK